MLMHGRLIVTHHGLMLDEVRSLLQKCLRRQELDLAYRATKELIGHEKDQLPWKSLVTFMFEDHCLTDVATLATFYEMYRQKNKFKAVEILGKCFTCRHAACLQVVALCDKYRLNAELWDNHVSLDPDFVGLVAKNSDGIDCDILIALVIKYWKEGHTSRLTTLFALVNMAAKVEKRSLTGKGSSFLIDSSIKKPSLYHLILSVLYKTSTDEYMKKFSKLCYRFAAIDDVPQGLIMFCVLSQMSFKDKVQGHAKPDMSNLGTVDWAAVPKLDHMPSWAVDKHTFRGKFGKESLHIFKKKFRNSPLSETELTEFHGPRPKADIKTFFEVGCVCNNDILEENPIFEKVKQMYYKQKPSQQKTAKMTQALYYELRKGKAACFRKQTGSNGDDKIEKKQLKRSLTSSSTDEPSCSGEPTCKQAKLTMPSSANGERRNVEEKLVTSSTVDKDETLKEITDDTRFSKSTSAPQGPLLQLPTGSAKVYTRLDNSTSKVWKGPYKSVSKQNLCIFLHRAMKEVFDDKHTMDLEVNGPFIIFPLLKSEKAEIQTIHKEFYDCIAKKQVASEEGVFITRESLGLVQLHKIPQDKLRRIPESLWAHFVFRYVLNIGDSGLYNAIATEDLGEIYGIDMEENRAAVKGNDVLNLMFTKLPKKSFVDEIKNVIREKKEAIREIFEKDFDFEKLRSLYTEYRIEDETERAVKRVESFKRALNKL